MEGRSVFGGGAQSLYGAQSMFGGDAMSAAGDARSFVGELTSYGYEPTLSPTHGIEPSEDNETTLGRESELGSIDVAFVHNLPHFHWTMVAPTDPAECSRIVGDDEDPLTAEELADGYSDALFAKAPDAEATRSLPDESITTSAPVVSPPSTSPRSSPPQSRRGTRWGRDRADRQGPGTRKSLIKPPAPFEDRASGARDGDGEGPWNRLRMPHVNSQTVSDRVCITVVRSPAHCPADLPRTAVSKWLLDRRHSFTFCWWAQGFSPSLLQASLGSLLAALDPTGLAKALASSDNPLPPEGPGVFEDENEAMTGRFASDTAGGLTAGSSPSNWTLPVFRAAVELHPARNRCAVMVLDGVSDAAVLKDLLVRVPSPRWGLHIICFDGGAAGKGVFSQPNAIADLRAVAAVYSVQYDPDAAARDAYVRWFLRAVGADIAVVPIAEFNDHESPAERDSLIMRLAGTVPHSPMLTAVVHRAKRHALRTTPTSHVIDAALALKQAMMHTWQGIAAVQLGNHRVPPPRGFEASCQVMAKSMSPAQGDTSRRRAESSFGAHPAFGEGAMGGSVVGSIGRPSSGAPGRPTLTAKDILEQRHDFGATVVVDEFADLEPQLLPSSGWQVRRGLLRTARTPRLAIQAGALIGAIIESVEASHPDAAAALQISAVLPSTFPSALFGTAVAMELFAWGVWLPAGHDLVAVPADVHAALATYILHRDVAAHHHVQRERRVRAIAAENLKGEAAARLMASLSGDQPAGGGVASVTLRTAAGESDMTPLGALFDAAADWLLVTRRNPPDCWTRWGPGLCAAVAGEAARLGVGSDKLAALDAPTAPGDMLEGGAGGGCTVTIDPTTRRIIVVGSDGGPERQRDGLGGPSVTSTRSAAPGHHHGGGSRPQSHAETMAQNLDAETTMPENQDEWGPREITAFGQRATLFAKRDRHQDAARSAEAQLLVCMQHCQRLSVAPGSRQAAAALRDRFSKARTRQLLAEGFDRVEAAAQVGAELASGEANKHAAMLRPPLVVREQQQRLVEWSTVLMQLFRSQGSSEVIHGPRALLLALCEVQNSAETPGGLARILQARRSVMAAGSVNASPENAALTRSTSLQRSATAGSEAPDISGQRQLASEREAHRRSAQNADELDSSIPGGTQSASLPPLSISAEMGNHSGLGRPPRPVAPGESSVSQAVDWAEESEIGKQVGEQDRGGTPGAPPAAVARGLAGILMTGDQLVAAETRSEACLAAAIAALDDLLAGRRRAAAAVAAKVAIASVSPQRPDRQVPLALTDPSSGTLVASQSAALSPTLARTVRPVPWGSSAAHGSWVGNMAISIRGGGTPMATQQNLSSLPVSLAAVALPGVFGLPSVTGYRGRQATTDVPRSQKAAAHLQLLLSYELASGPARSVGKGVRANLVGEVAVSRTTTSGPGASEAEPEGASVGLATLPVVLTRAAVEESDEWRMSLFDDTLVQRALEACAALHRFVRPGRTNIYYPAMVAALRAGPGVADQPWEVTTAAVARVAAERVRLENEAMEGGAGVPGIGGADRTMLDFADSASVGAAAAGREAGALGGIPVDPASIAAKLDPVQMRPGPPPPVTEAPERGVPLGLLAAVFTLMVTISRLYTAGSLGGVGESYAERAAALSLAMCGGRRDTPARSVASLLLGHTAVELSEAEGRRAIVTRRSRVLSDDPQGDMQLHAQVRAEVEQAQYIIDASKHYGEAALALAKTSPGLTGDELSRGFEAMAAALTAEFRDREALKTAQQAHDNALACQRTTATDVCRVPAASAATLRAAVAWGRERFGDFITAIRQRDYKTTHSLLDQSVILGLLAEVVMVDADGNELTAEAEEEDTTRLQAAATESFAAVAVKSLLERQRGDAPLANGALSSNPVSGGLSEMPSFNVGRLRALSTFAQTVVDADASNMTLVSQGAGRNPAQNPATRSFFGRGQAASPMPAASPSRRSRAVSMLDPTRDQDEPPRYGLLSHMSGSVTSNSGIHAPGFGSTADALAAHLSSSMGTSLGRAPCVHPPGGDLVVQDAEIVAARRRAAAEIGGVRPLDSLPALRRTEGRGAVVFADGTGASVFAEAALPAPTRYDHLRCYAALPPRVLASHHGADWRGEVGHPLRGRYVFAAHELVRTCGESDVAAIELLRRLLDNGLDPRACSPHDMKTLLHIAVERELFLCIGLLLSHPLVDVEYTAPHILEARRTGLANVAVVGPAANPLPHPLLTCEDPLTMEMLLLKCRDPIDVVERNAATVARLMVRVPGRLPSLFDEGAPLADAVAPVLLENTIPPTQRVVLAPFCPLDCVFDVVQDMESAEVARAVMRHCFLRLSPTPPPEGMSEADLFESGAGGVTAADLMALHRGSPALASGPTPFVRSVLRELSVEEAQAFAAAGERAIDADHLDVATVLVEEFGAALDMMRIDAAARYTRARRARLYGIDEATLVAMERAQAEEETTTDAAVTEASAQSAEMSAGPLGRRGSGIAVASLPGSVASATQRNYTKDGEGAHKAGRATISMHPVVRRRAASHDEEL